MPMDAPLLSTPPRLRVSRVPDYSVVPRRSVRLAGSGKPRAAKPEIQATNVMVMKLGKTVPPPANDQSTVRRFQETFAEPLSASKREPQSHHRVDGSTASMLEC